jgi:cytoskeletal protein RodZ
MEPITSNTILILSGSFLCVFLSLVSIGGAFLFFRTRQQQASDVPPPQPPPVTRDVHAKQLGEVPTRTDSLSEMGVQPVPLPPPPPPPRFQKRESESRTSPMPADDTLEMSTQPLQSTDPEVTQVQSRQQPLGIDSPPNDEQNDDGMTTTRSLTNLTLDIISLPEPSDDENTPTIIMDRSKPLVDDDDS